MNAGHSPVMLIAGGTGSIGSEIAAQAASAGWTVALHGRSSASVDAATQSLSGRVPGVAMSGHAADFGEPGSIERLVDEVAARHERIDALVDCSVGGPEGVTGFFADTRPEAYDGFASHSVIAFQRLAHAAMPLLVRSRGCLIACVSDAGIFAAPRQSVLGAMRAATIGFVRNLAVETARDGVRVHAISPSFVEETAVARRISETSAKRMETARKRAGLGLPTPADIAPLVLFLCGPGALRMTGQVISINGGMNA